MLVLEVSEEEQKNFLFSWHFVLESCLNYNLCIFILVSSPSLLYEAEKTWVVKICFPLFWQSGSLLSEYTLYFRKMDEFMSSLKRMLTLN